MQDALAIWEIPLAHRPGLGADNDPHPPAFRLVKKPCSPRASAAVHPTDRVGHFQSQELGHQTFRCWTNMRSLGYLHPPARRGIMALARRAMAARAALPSPFGRGAGGEGGWHGKHRGYVHREIRTDHFAQGSRRLDGGGTGDCPNFRVNENCPLGPASGQRTDAAAGPPGANAQ